MRKVLFFFLAVCAIGAVLYFLLASSILAAPAAEQQAFVAAMNLSSGSEQVYNASLINSSINQTREYIQTVNRSAYLIFYPNLSLAQSYLNKSISIQSNAIIPDQQKAADISSFLAKARLSAYEQQVNIYKYRAISFKVLIIALIIILFVLYFISSMSQRRRVAQGKKQGRMQKSSKRQ
ncbi:MAG: hypothetical protein M1124_01400 [Candidatus Marsarchaeota archaeon]|jgi:hypothetical protein|nr:hypothetical protein [Candidatus Marsarchaeota archaeon]